MATFTQVESTVHEPREVFTGSNTAGPRPPCLGGRDFMPDSEFPGAAKCLRRNPQIFMAIEGGDDALYEKVLLDIMQAVPGCSLSRMSATGGYSFAVHSSVVIVRVERVDHFQQSVLCAFWDGDLLKYPSGKDSLHAYGTAMLRPLLPLMSRIRVYWYPTDFHSCTSILVFLGALGNSFQYVYDEEGPPSLASAVFYDRRGTYFAAVPGPQFVLSLVLHDCLNLTPRFRTSLHTHLASFISAFLDRLLSKPHIKTTLEKVFGVTDTGDALLERLRDLSDSVFTCATSVLRAEAKTAHFIRYYFVVIDIEKWTESDIESILDQNRPGNKLCRRIENEFPLPHVDSGGVTFSRKR